MAASHVAHDCEVGNHVVFANAALLGGHVSVATTLPRRRRRRFTCFCRIGEKRDVAGHASITPTCRTSRWWRSATR